MTGGSPTPVWTVASGARQDEAEEEYSAEPMSYDEMMKLARDIHKLSGDKLGAVVQIVQSREQLPATNAVEVEIDIESLKPTTLHALKTFVASCWKKDAQTPGVGDDDDMENDESGSEFNETSGSESLFFDEEDY
ncbi:unnamed protein product [Gongylonema pulchrum]|uniref:NET domain-containing protein n=1 Tax=Gongylonema pulchrum TaxID=637853 RepID=A0A183DQ91_9BILA|nr:unnamed protein product [Gongylonema pulchrum]